MKESSSPYLGDPLDEKEKEIFRMIVDTARYGERNELCLIRGTLDGKSRGCVALVHSKDDGSIIVRPVAVILTEDETEKILGPCGEPTVEG